MRSGRFRPHDAIDRLLDVRVSDDWGARATASAFRVGGVPVSIVVVHVCLLPLRPITEKAILYGLSGQRNRRTSSLYRATSQSVADGERHPRDGTKVNENSSLRDRWYGGTAMIYKGNTAWLGERTTGHKREASSNPILTSRKIQQRNTTWEPSAGKCSGAEPIPTTGPQTTNFDHSFSAPTSGPPLQADKNTAGGEDHLAHLSIALSYAQIGSDPLPGVCRAARVRRGGNLGVRPPLALAPEQQASSTSRLTHQMITVGTNSREQELNRKPALLNAFYRVPSAQ